jgi:uncharacterized protein YbbK (DUF523 family)
MKSSLSDATKNATHSATTKKQKQGATTLDEYRKYIEKDAALARRCVLCGGVVVVNSGSCGCLKIEGSKLDGRVGIVYLAPVML